MVLCFIALTAVYADHVRNTAAVRAYNIIIILLTHQYDRHEDEAPPPFKCKRIRRTSPMSSIASLFRTPYTVLGEYKLYT